MLILTSFCFLGLSYYLLERMSIGKDILSLDNKIIMKILITCDKCRGKGQIEKIVCDRCGKDDYNIAKDPNTEKEICYRCWQELLTRKDIKKL